MPKARLTIVIEYDMNPEDYEGEVDPEVMLQVDRDNYDEGNLDIGMFLSDDIVDVQWEVASA